MDATRIRQIWFFAARQIESRNPDVIMAASALSRRIEGRFDGYAGKQLTSREAEELANSLERSLDIGELVLEEVLPIRIRARNGLEMKPAPSHGQPVRPEPVVELSFVGLRLLDQHGRSVAGAAYRIILPNGEDRRGELDASGNAMVRNVPPGACRISCPFVESASSSVHVVKEGEHLTGIAHIYQISRSAIEQHPRNSALMKLRKNGNVLQPEDVIQIPERKTTWVERPTGAIHEFRVTRDVLKLKVRFLDFLNRPIPEAQVRPSATLGCVSSTYQESVLNAELPPQYRFGALELRTASEENRRFIDVGVGDLDPVDIDTGSYGRLLNLGYLHGPLSGPFDDRAVKLAWECFQADHKLPVTGEADVTSRARLAEVHGI